jgi:putative transposase
MDELVISLSAKGLTTGEISALFAEVWGADVSKDTISKIACLGAGRLSRFSWILRWRSPA